MTPLVSWDSQPLQAWAERHAEGRFVDLDGQRTHYIVEGEGPPVVLLHGFYFDSGLWAANRAALARRFTIHLVDLWGFGYSSRAPMDYGYPLFARQLELFLDALGLDRVALVGQSLGAGTSIHFATDHPDRVERLLGVAPAGMPNPLPWTARIFRLPGLGELLVSIPGYAVHRKNLRDFFVHDPALLTDELVRDVSQFQRVRGTRRALLSILRRDFFDTLSDRVARFGELAIPTLLYCGRQDRSIPFHCFEAMHRLIPHSELVAVDDAGHVPNLDRPDHFADVACRFLSGGA